MQYRVSCVVIVAFETPAYRYQWRASSRFEVHLQSHQDRCALPATTEPPESRVIPFGAVNTTSSSKELAGLEPCLFFQHHTSASSVYCTYAEYSRNQVHVRCMQVTCIYRRSRIGPSREQASMQQDYKTRNDTIIYTFTFVHIRVLTGGGNGTTALPPAKASADTDHREEEPVQGLEKVFLEGRDDV